MKAKGLWAGMAGPLIFVSVFLIEGWLRPNYSVSRLEVSALSLGTRGWIQILNFIVTGSCFLLFASYLATQLKDWNGFKFGVSLLSILGICLILSGIFVMDPPNTPRPLWTLHGWAHRLLGAVAFTIFPLSCFVFRALFRHKTGWKPFRRWSLRAGCLMVLAIAGMKIGQSGPPDSFFAAWFGLFQRVVLIVYMGWVFTLARRVSTLTGIPSATGEENPGR